MTVYNHPTCSKCNKLLTILKEKGFEPKIINYLETPPSKDELISIIQKLGIRPLDLIRQKETVFQTQYAGKKMSDQAYIDAMLKYPILIERPIVIDENRAIIGRPVVKIFDFL